MRRILAAFCAAVSLFTASTARAEFVTWTATGSDVTVYNTNNPIKTSSFLFTGVSATGTSMVGAHAGTTTQIYSITVSSTATPSAFDSFLSAPFSLPITLTDQKSVGLAGAVSSGTVTLSGKLSAQHVSENTILPGNMIADSSAQIVLGSPGDWRLYTLSIHGTVPGPGFTAGEVVLDVKVSSTTDPPSAAPEPASLVLAGLAVPLLLTMTVTTRKRKRRGLE